MKLPKSHRNIKKIQNNLISAFINACGGMLVIYEKHQLYLSNTTMKKVKEYIESREKRKMKRKKGKD